MTLNKIFFFLLKSLAVLVGLALVYALCGYLIPFIEVSAKKTDEPKVIEAFILTNGVHTDLVVPIKNEVMDWGKELPFDNTISKRYDFSYISIGWGDKGFYLDTPTWAELKVSTALIAGLGIGTTALHIIYYKDIQEDDLTIKVAISKEQYASIVSTVKKNLQYENGKSINIKTNAQYNENDAFYEAIGSYSIFHTCNTWTNNTLREAMLPSLKWLAFDRGILDLYKKSEP